MSNQPEGKAHVVTFEVDGEPVETTEKTLTPNQIMQLAGADSATHYLVLIEGREQTSYEGHGDDPIHIHEKQKFITVATGPTPVS
jgi:hypothetical protein